MSPYAVLIGFLLAIPVSAVIIVLMERQFRDIERGK